jgi:diacylglycerol kinase family enzyme
MVFIGANPLQLDQLPPEIAARVESGALAIVVVRAIDAWRLVKFAWRALFGAVLDAPEIDAVAVQSATVSLRKRRTRVVVDGELITVPVPFEVRVRPNALLLRAPELNSTPSDLADR